MIVLCIINARPPRSTFFPYTTLFRSGTGRNEVRPAVELDAQQPVAGRDRRRDAQRRRQHHGLVVGVGGHAGGVCHRSEEHTSELQSRENLVCRLLLEKKKTNTTM